MMKILKVFKMSWWFLWTSLVYALVTPICILGAPILNLFVWKDEAMKEWEHIPDRKQDKFDEKIMDNLSVRSIIEGCGIDVKVMKKPVIKVKGKELRSFSKTFAYNYTGIRRLEHELREMRSWGLGRVYLLDYTMPVADKNERIYPGLLTISWAMHRDIGSKPADAWVTRRGPDASTCKVA